MAQLSSKTRHSTNILLLICAASPQCATRERKQLGELEARYDFNPRWSILGFAGAGKAVSDRGNGDSDMVVSKGLGFRYLIARRFGMRAGIDVAWGPEVTAFYIQMGSAWGR